VPDRRLSVSLRQSAPIPLDVEFTCGPGEVLAIFGPSGSGKSTILRSVAGLYRPAHASVHCADEVWTDTAGATFTPPHRRAVGFVFQEYALFPHLTAVGNVMAALGHRPKSLRRADAESLLALVHVTAQMSRRPHELSGGERQRVALARALARQPKVLLLDEPFAAVDRSVRRRLQAQVDRLRQRLDIPLVLVTHDFDDVARLATHVLLLEQGRNVASGPLAELTSRPDLTFLRDAVGLGSVFDAVTSRPDPDRGLLELTFDGGTLLAPMRDIPVGIGVRVRIPAREIILATSPPNGLSVHNVVPCTVSALHAEENLDQVVVQIAVGNLRLLAEVTRDAVARLRIAVGLRLYALIKSVSVDLQAMQSADLGQDRLAHTNPDSTF
jgi:molybdate transport system ATP-binding protein